MKAKNNSLKKKVLFSLVAASMLSGFVLSAEAAESITIHTGEATRSNVDVSYVDVSQGAKLTLDGGKVEGESRKIDDFLQLS